MKITVIYGIAHKGSTYNCVKILLEQIRKTENVELTEFFLPQDMPHYCIGCFSCIKVSEEKCPHYPSVKPIAEAMNDADIIILASPVYVYDVTGQMKALLDHFAYQWIIHRPNPNMFGKIGIAISTTAGAGTKRTNETMKKSFDFWGLKRVFTYGYAVKAANWESVKSENKEIIISEISVLAKKVIKASKRVNKLRPTLTTKFWFSLVKKFVKNKNWNKADKEYWQLQGWTDGKNPWS